MGVQAASMKCGNGEKTQGYARVKAWQFEGGQGAKGRQVAQPVVSRWLRDRPKQSPLELTVFLFSSSP